MQSFISIVLGITLDLTTGIHTKSGELVQIEII